MAGKNSRNVKKVRNAIAKNRPRLSSDRESCANDDGTRQSRRDETVQEVGDEGEEEDVMMNVVTQMEGEEKRYLEVQTQTGRGEKTSEEKRSWRHHVSAENEWTEDEPTEVGKTQESDKNSNKTKIGSR